MNLDLTAEQTRKPIDSPKGERKREAWEKLRGYQYQIWYAVSQWLTLPPTEDLFIECAEDVDRATLAEIELNQLKNTGASLSLNTAQAMKALTDFWTIKDLNRNRRVRFNYITTGEIVEETSRSFSGNRKGIEVWQSAKTKDSDVDEIRKFLIEKAAGGKPAKASTPVKAAKAVKSRNAKIPVVTSEVSCETKPPLHQGIVDLLGKSIEQIRDELIMPVTWYPDSISFDRLQESVSNLIFAYSDRINDPLHSDDTITLRNTLFAEASATATSNSERRLTAQRLTDLFKNMTMLRIPRSVYRQLFNPEHLMAPAPKAVTINWATTFSGLEEWPTTVGQNRELKRAELEQITSCISTSKHSAQIILGEAGSGKSALLAKLGQSLTKEGVPHLGIKADLLSKNMASFEELIPDLGTKTIVEAIKAASSTRLFVIIVDQLDALCSLIDRSTKRLSLILQLLSSLGGVNGVHIVASCRPFELASDPRLLNLGAAQVQLSLPSWEQVSDILLAEGINISEFNGGSKEVLRVPWNLKLFLELPQPRPVLVSFYDLVGRVWSSAIRDSENPARCLELVETLAQRIDESEEFWLPQDLTDGFVQERARLVSEGILMELSGHDRLGFRHQTFFDYFLIRTFFREKVSIADYLSKHEQSFFIRPTVARALAYLRSTNPSIYHKSLREFLKQGRLRLHLYLLVLEFVGRQSVPTNDEIRICLPLLENGREGKRFLQSAVGSQGWFKALLTSDFEAKWMKGPPDCCQVAATVLGGATANAENEVIALINKNWSTELQYDQLALGVLGKAVNWYPNTIILLETYIARSNSNDVDWVLRELVRNAPSKAAPLIGAQFRNKAKAAFEEIEAFRESQTSEATLESADLPTNPNFLHKGNFEDDLPVAEMKRLLATDLFHHAGLSRVANADPSAFLNEFWSTVNKGLEVNQQANIEGIHYDSNWIELDHGRYANRTESILWTVEIALKKLAETVPSTFFVWVDANKVSALLTVHRLIASGMLMLSPDHADSVISYLTEDYRRLYLGAHSDDSKDSRELLTKFAPNSSPEPLQSLLKKIVDLPPNFLGKIRQNSPNTTEERAIARLDRDRMRLLMSCIPSSRVNGLRFQSPRASFVGARVRAEELVVLTDQAIFEVIDSLPDGTKFNSRPELDLEISRCGGSVEQSRAVAEFSVTNADRAKEILRRLQPGRHEEYAGTILGRLTDPRPQPAVSARTPPLQPVIATEQIEQLTIEFDQRGFASPLFRSSTAQSLQTLAQYQNGLKKETLGMLRSWVEQITTPTLEDEGPPDTGVPEHSILFSPGGSWICVGGRATIVEAIVQGGLRQKPPAIQETVDFLEELLKKEKHPGVWAETLINISWLFGSISSRMTILADTLFRDLPSLWAYPQTAAFLAEIIGNVSPMETEEKWIHNLLAIDSSYLRQLAGEMAFLHYGRRQTAWSKRLIESGLAGVHGHDFRLGLTYAAAVGVTEAHLTPEVESVLGSAMDSNDGKLQDAAASFLTFINDKNWNALSMRLVLKLIQHDHLVKKNSDILGRQMEIIGTVDPETSMKFAEVMRGIMSNANSRVHGWAVVSYLTAIALTAQRDLETRERGLNLFEWLLEMNLAEAKKAAEQMNHRESVNRV